MIKDCLVGGCFIPMGLRPLPEVKDLLSLGGKLRPLGRGSDSFPQHSTLPMFPREKSSSQDLAHKQRVVLSSSPQGEKS